MLNDFYSSDLITQILHFDCLDYILKYKPIQPSDSDMSERVVRKGLLKCYISNERLGYQIDGDDSNTIPKGSKKFYYDKEKK